MSQRQDEFHAWIASHIDGELRINSFSGGAGLRQYYRVSQGENTCVAVDAPPATEKVSEFVALASILSAEGILVPDIMAHDTAQGFMLISDFGRRTLRSALNAGNVDRYYHTAMETLIPIHHSQQARKVNNTWLSGSFLHSEIIQFYEWYLKRYCGMIVDASMRKMLDGVFTALADSADAQEQVCCHRDYHSDNLMALPDGRLGVLDFQDMMMGPITYDVVSLLRDCYVSWPEAQVDQWVMTFYGMLRESGFLHGITLDVFVQWFDWMGMQRHIKAIITFAAKALRDDDEQYLAYIPRTLRYLEMASARYPIFSDFNVFIKELSKETV